MRNKAKAPRWTGKNVLSTINSPKDLKVPSHRCSRVLRRKAGERARNLKVKVKVAGS